MATKYGSTLIQQIYKKIIVVVIINHWNTIVNTTQYDDRTNASNEIIHYNQVNFLFEFIIFFSSIVFIYKLKINYYNYLAIKKVM